MSTFQNVPLRLYADKGPSSPRLKTPVKPYGYEITVGVADAKHVQFGGPPSATLTLYRTGTEAVVQSWAFKQVRKVRGRAMQVVSIDHLKPLTREEYESVMRQKKGWPALPTQNREEKSDV